MVPGTGQDVTKLPQEHGSSPRSTAGHGAAEGLRTWSSARSQRVTQSAEVSPAGSQNPGTKRRHAEPPDPAH